ncbi:nitroreductase family protein [Bacillus tuaregi]|uniref:nitroreductase family protein n=1 Tax=Bacillus tuaregi TaxID=1816695 RepID=UPI0008F91563|nr:nitroreductase family protein [Bacillus tuaregi]
MTNIKEKTTSKDFYSAIKERRSYYSINNEPIVSDDRIEEIMNMAVLHNPSPMNSQSSRVVLLTGKYHYKLWNLTKETLRKIVPAENFEPTEQKINQFRNGYGTVLFFEDQEVVKGLEEKFELYKDSFPGWSLQTSAMLQNTIWTALEVEGFGASLQHYNPLIDDEVKELWDIPSHWKLIAQMPFGKPTAPPKEKPIQAIEERVLVLK